ncbi:MAG: hypothetical protein JW846_01880 [Dehalococcoidia bacterium]|nr:hypothetical protein [Dehalococcoidia bacterium]
MWLRRRVVRIFKDEGVTGLVRAAVAMVQRSARRIAFIGDFYIYRYPVPLTDVHIPESRIEGVEVHVVESERDIDTLVADGYEDLRFVMVEAGSRLSVGAVAICAFVHKEFAYVGWVALSEPAKRAFDRLPYYVDFEAGEGCTGAAWTTPRFRKAGLYAHVFGHELRYLREAGRTVCCNAIGTGNVASQRGQARYGAQLCAVGRIRRFLVWRRWVMTPAEGSCPSLASTTMPR